MVGQGVLQYPGANATEDRELFYLKDEEGLPADVAFSSWLTFPLLHTVRSPAFFTPFASDHPEDDVSFRIVAMLLNVKVPFAAGSDSEGKPIPEFVKI